MTEDWIAPSTVFARRLRETRDRRNLSQTDLAVLLADAGRKMSKPALLRIESGERKVSLDEALAFAWALQASPANLLSPDEGAMLALTEKAAVDGDALRHWLVTGQAIPAWPADPDADDRANLDEILKSALTAYSVAMVDASRAGDKAGAQAAADAIVAAVERHRGALARIAEKAATHA